MFLLLNVEVTIGKIVMKSVNSIEIKSSWKELTDTATITIPRNLKYKNKSLDQYIQRGDNVIIKMGVNGTLNTEFTGYVREVEPNMPIKIYCEDEMLRLKKGMFTKSWTNLKLKELLAYIAPGYTYQVDDTTIGKFSVHNKSAAQILLDLREYGIYSYFRAVDGTLTLHSGFPYSFQFNKVIYHMQKNVKKNNLKFRRAEDYKVQVKAIANLPTGKKTIVYFPSEDKIDGAEVRTLNYGELSSDETTRKALLEKYAEAERARFNVNGYRGSLTGFAIPVTRHGDVATIRNDRYPEYDGDYIIDSVALRFGEVYFERINELGPRV